MVLIEHALTGDGDAADWWTGIIGPGLALDTTQYLVLCANCLGGCQGSTGPASEHPDGGFWGSRFPALSIRDLVQAEKQLIVDVLGIDQIRGVVGASMGGARVLEWTFMYPEQRRGGPADRRVRQGLRLADRDAVRTDPLHHR